MARTKPQTNQLIQKVLLAELGAAADTDLDSLFSKISQSFRDPLRLFASSTPDALLNIMASQVTVGDAAGKSVGTIDTTIPTFVATTINFQTGSVSGGTVNGALPSSTIGQFRRVAFSLKSDGTVDMTFSAEVASLGSLANPATLFTSGAQPIGWVDLEATAATAFKTAGSATSVIENSVGGTARIVRIGAGGGSGGGAASISTDSPAGNVTTVTKGTIYQMDSSAARTIQLPAPAAGFYFWVSDKIGTMGTFNTTLLRNGSELINRLGANFALEADFGFWFVWSDGTDYYVA